ncbi:MAG: FHA domain-containing protein [Anaerolineaceae bacterium]|nr:FHA domain-containing protein [Anaerolineaceae bacterium]
MTDKKVCKACEKLNDVNATVCAYCNTPFQAMSQSLTTSHVPPPPPNNQFTPERVIQLTGLYADLIVFQIANFEQPLLVKVSGDAVTIGRYSPGEKPPTVDLTPFNGSLMGVSRQHAMITKDESGYKVKDLSSTNGTWLNEVRLPAQEFKPLQSGDILRLGQINTSVYFRLNQAKNPSETSLTLSSDVEDTIPLKLTAKNLETILTPYLKAIEGFQKACDEVMSQPISEVLFISIAKDTEKAQIVVRTSGLFQAFRLLRINIVRWREMHLETIKKINENPPVIYRDWTIEPTANSSDASDDLLKLDKQLRESAIELANEILADLAPHRNKEDNKIHIPKILPFIQQLALSPLRLLQD